MPIQEVLGAAGRYDVQLREDTPQRVLDACAINSTNGFQQLVVTPVEMDPRKSTDLGMLAASRYVGLHRMVEGRTRLVGAHIGVLLGDEDGKGDILESPVTTARGYLSEWFSALSYAPVFTNGTWDSPGGEWTGVFHRVTRKEAWDTLRKVFGVEWRVAPNASGVLTFDVGRPSALWGIQPKLVVLRNSGRGGRDTTLTGIEGSAVLTSDVEDFASKVILLHKDPNPPAGVSSPPPLVTTVTGANPYTSPSGGALIMDKLVDMSSQVLPDPTKVAQAELDAVNSPRYELSVAPDVYDLGNYTQVGAPIYVYDPLGSAVDLSNPVQFRGSTIFPIRVRVTGIRTPIRRGMGVYLRRVASATPVAIEWVDLTPYVEFESGPSSIDVGAVRRV